MSKHLYLSGNEAADQLLESNSFAVMVGMLLDQQVRMEDAFAGPEKIRQRLGEIDPQSIADCPLDKLVQIFSESPAVHRFPKSMAERVHNLAQVIVAEYHGDAAAIWTEGEPSAAEILRRLKALPGFGVQKSQIFLALLGKQFGLDAEGWQKAAGMYGEPGTRLSIADVTSEETLHEVRETKKAMKAAAKAKK